MKAVAYVASTLPIAQIDKYVQVWGINRIVLHGRTHLASYKYLQKRHPNVDLKVLPDSMFLKTMSTLLVLLQLKLTGQTIFFFHECCCPFFDLLVKLIRPNGHHYPQVTLQSFVPIPESSVPATRMQKALRLLRLHQFFSYYRGESDNEGGYFIVQSIKEYPANIKMHSIYASRQPLMTEFDSAKDCHVARRVLLLCGRDIQSDQAINELYRSVLDLAIRHGYACDIKDHPAAHARLNFKDDRATVIDFALPLEFVEDRYAMVIGMGSTGLLHFPEKGISLLRVGSCANDDSISRRIAHLRSMPGGKSITFPESLDALEELLIKWSGRVGCLNN